MFNCCIKKKKFKQEVKLPAESTISAGKQLESQCGLWAVNIYLHTFLLHFFALSFHAINSISKDSSLKNLKRMMVEFVSFDHC